jgi:Predicted Zn peptidase
LEGNYPFMTHSIDQLLSLALAGDQSNVNLHQLFEGKLEEYGVSKTKALGMLGIDKDVFEDIISGTARQPNLVHILKLAQFLGIGIEAAVQAVLKEQPAANIASLERSYKATFLLKHFDTRRLTAAGVMEKTEDPGKAVGRLMRFFGYDSMMAFEERLETPLFSRTKRLFSDKMMKFWIDAAYRMFELIANPNPYDREAVKDIVAKAKPYCKDVNDGLYKVCRALYAQGVTVITQELLAGTQVRGGTFYVHNKPCIVLTDFRKSYPTVWTTLLHELHHVLFDLEVIKDWKFHLSEDGQNDLFLIEEKANAFAMDYFCTLEEFEFIRRHIHSKYHVERFAVQRNVHPAMIYNAYQFYEQRLTGKNFWGAFKSEIPKSDTSLKRLQPVTWKEESIEAIAKKFQSIFLITNE